MDKVNLLGLTAEQFETLMIEQDEKAFKGRQLFKWVYNEAEFDFDRMTDLSVKLRKKLRDNFRIAGPKTEKISRSTDGTEKLLFRLVDNRFIETVVIPDRDKKTVCISSQVGCPLGCRFCATGQMGFERNLSIGEIVGQLLFLRQRDGRDAFHNIVFMGMGEPLLNYENVIDAIGIIASELGLSFSAKRITVSTVGIVPQIYSLADSDLKVKLAISLHAASDAKRRTLMPVAKKYNLDQLMKAAKYFAEKKKKRITFEYILFRGFNDSREDALSLSRLIQGIPCKINILAYNPVGDLPYSRPDDDEVDEFGKILYPRAPAVTVRKSRGLDIGAACGQLAVNEKRQNRENKG
nr:23S rRNA (adenine(2503)-C(2))-methyltransferase RlmN [candidate division Zixibacteria bacterium]